MLRVTSKLILGVGINDHPGHVRYRVNGVWTTCPIYTKWHGMLERSFSDRYKSKYPSYRDVSCVEEWLKFSNFRSWVLTQQWEGLELDKDILVEGSKIYSPETCCFVPKEVNYLLLDSRAIRGKLPLGVDFRKKENVYRARVSGVKLPRGSTQCKTPEEAHRVWQYGKIDSIESKILWYMLQPCYDQRVANALYLRAERLRADIEANRETVRL